MDGIITGFRAEYDDETDMVVRSGAGTVPERLKSWFQTLDTAPDVWEIVQELQDKSEDFGDWYNKCRKRDKKGAATLLWPNGEEERLGMELLFFRAAADGKVDIGQAGYLFISAPFRNLDESTRRFVKEVFSPFARELRAYLERRLANLLTDDGGRARALLDENTDQSVPASDRVVRLDHNSPEYIQVMNALDELESGLKGKNDYEDMELRDQHVAEVSAGRRLLQAIRVRSKAIVGVLAGVLGYVSLKFADTALGQRQLHSGWAGCLE
jgi:hypothetical protein